MDALRPANDEKDIVAPGEGVPTADQILDKYIQALGGAQRLGGNKLFQQRAPAPDAKASAAGASFKSLARLRMSERSKSYLRTTRNKREQRGLQDGTAGWRS